MANPPELRGGVTGDAVGEAKDGGGSKTSKELAALRAALVRLTEMVDELARRQRDKGAE